MRKGRAAEQRTLLTTTASKTHNEREKERKRNPSCGKAHATSEIFELFLQAGNEFVVHGGGCDGGAVLALEREALDQDDGVVLRDNQPVPYLEVHIDRRLAYAKEWGESAPVPSCYGTW